ncbi:MAG: efflux RND transporter permease subunit [Bacteroidales bacterium]|nr:efflux RND transporter permease subunit [Bacteroidales bacterium]
MERGGIHRFRLSPFSVVLVMVAMSIVGIACLPMLKVQYAPSAPGRSITVAYTLSDASPEIIEAEATSRIEGILSLIRGTTGVASVSKKGSGSVAVSFQKGTDMDAARFEVASAIRNIYPSLPREMSYPTIRLSSGGNRGAADISFFLKGPLPSQEIESYAREHILPAVSRIGGVESVSLSGATPYHWVITFDAARATSLGISASDIVSAFDNAFFVRVLGMADTPDGDMVVRLSGSREPDFGGVFIKKVGGRTVFLRDIATWRYEESLPRSYFRVNGLNTITVAVSVAENANLISTARSVHEEMLRLRASFPEEISASTAYDASEYVREELRKIYFRTGLCLVILLLFVFLVTRSWRYLLIIASTLAVNILSSLAIYALAGIPIHVYTLAGITVSLGMVIDTSIVMADHFGYWKDRGVFPALLAATVTTVCALLALFLLPESERANLTDFIWVIALNLSLSLLVAALFIPSLMYYLPVNGTRKVSVKHGRIAVRGNLLHRRYIRWGISHRWVLLVLFVLVFGLPTCLIPDTVNWEPYKKNRAVIDKWTGASFGLFFRSVEHANFYAVPERKQLYIRAGMPEGCTVNQLNEVVKSMEKFLTGFDEIQSFTTSIYSYDNATIVVYFKPEYEQDVFPLRLKSQVTAMAIHFGGANWSVYGLDEQGFDNNIVSFYKAHRISLTGYNFHDLLRYSQILVDHLSTNRRVSGPEIWSAGYEGGPDTEYNLDYDFGAMMAAGINPYHYYGVLSSRLCDQNIGTVLIDGTTADVVLHSSEADSFDLWHVLHEPVQADSHQVALSSVGSIAKKRSGIDIRRVNQSYLVDVCFDFVGSYPLARQAITEAVDYMNGEVLPIGYKAENPQTGWFQQHKERYLWLLLLIIGIIFVLLSMSFDSLRLPLSIIFMIPVSFIGLFLVFGLSGAAFDQGGFASFVMLCGIVVNAGIYMLSAFGKFGGFSARGQANRIRIYVKAFNHKITPILLTVLSTALGLIPFLTDGPEVVFWFDFALGSIGGLLFSVLALVFYLPVFAIRRK